MKKLFALLGIVALFAACQPDDLDVNTSYDPVDPQPAVATVTVTTIDLATAEEVKVDALTTTFEGATVTSNGNGWTITITGDNEIAGGWLSATATYEGETYTSSQLLYINDLEADAVASYSATMLVGEVVVPPTISTTITKDTSSSDETLYPEWATISYDGKYWAENLTMYYFTGNVTYDVYTGMELASENCEIAEYEEYFNAYVAAFENLSITKSTATVGYTALAGSYYTVEAVYTTTVDTYTVTITVDGVASTLGTFSTQTKSQVVTPDCIESPNNHSHGHGHYGHGHGSSGNSGGGIISAE